MDGLDKTLNVIDSHKQTLGMLDASLKKIWTSMLVYVRDMGPFILNKNVPEVEPDKMNIAMFELTKEAIFNGQPILNQYFEKWLSDKSTAHSKTNLTNDKKSIITQYYRRLAEVSSSGVISDPATDITSILGENLYTLKKSIDTPFLQGVDSSISQDTWESKDSRRKAAVYWRDKLQQLFRSDMFSAEITDRVSYEMITRMISDKKNDMYQKKRRLQSKLSRLPRNSYESEGVEDELETISDMLEQLDSRSNNQLKHMIAENDKDFKKFIQSLKEEYNSKKKQTDKPGGKSVGKKDINTIIQSDMVVYAYDFLQYVINNIKTVGKTIEKTDKYSRYLMLQTINAIVGEETKKVLTEKNFYEFPDVIAYISFLFYYNILIDLLGKRTKIIGESKVSSGYKIGMFGIGSEAYKDKLWLEKNNLVDFYETLNLDRVKQGSSMLQSLETLNERPEVKKLVVHGRDNYDIERLERAIAVLKEETKQKADAKRLEEEEVKKAKELAIKQEAEELKQKEIETLKLREEMERAEKENVRDPAEAKPTTETVETKPPTDTVPQAEPTPEVKTPEPVKTLSLYERIFGTSEEAKEAKESVVKEGDYIPADKRVLKIAEEELQEYKDTRKKLEEQIKTDKLRYQDKVIFLRNQLTDKLKDLEYLERGNKDKLKTQNQSIEQLKGELEEVATKLRKKQHGINRKEQKYKKELTELNTILKVYSRRLRSKEISDKNRYLLESIHKYKGTSDSLSELRKRLEKLTEIPIMVSPAEKKTKKKSRKKKNRSKRSKRKRSKRKRNKT